MTRPFLSTGMLTRREAARNGSRVCGLHAELSRKARLQQGLLVLHHMLVLLLGLAGIRRFVLFGLVGLSGMLVNTGSLMALQALGFDPVGWPLWAATELAILWNYTLNRNFTWRDRGRGSWWQYNLAALGASGIAIGITTVLLLSGDVALWLASVGGIVTGMCLNYLVLDSLVFSGLSWLAVHRGLHLLVHRTLSSCSILNACIRPATRHLNRSTQYCSQCHAR